MCTPPMPLVRGEDTLAAWRGGAGSIVWKTPDTALYSIYVSTLWLNASTTQTVCLRWVRKGLHYSLQESLGWVEWVGWDGWDRMRWDVAEWLDRLTDNAKIATVLGSIPASSDTVESEGQQMKQCWIKYRHIQKSAMGLKRVGRN
jgi:hypothetical protein